MDLPKSTSSLAFLLLLFISALMSTCAGVGVDPSSWMDVNPTIYNPPPDDHPTYTTSSAAVTTTVQSRPVITTIEVPYSVTTAAADDGDVKAGDLIVELSQSYRSHLVDVAKQACGLPGKRAIILRAAPACDMDQFLQGAIGDGAPGGLDIVSFNKPIIRANNIEAAIRKIFALRRPLFKSRLWIGGISVVALGLYVENKLENMDGPIHIPKADLGDPTGETVLDQPDPTASPGGGSTSGCKTTKSGTATPICNDVANCNGMAHQTCEVENDDKSCPCATYLDPRTHDADPDFTSVLQSILQTVMFSPAPAPTPDTTHQCLYNQDPRGEMSKSPTEWCVCDVSSTYSVVSGTSPCPLSITNGPTITLQPSSTKPPPPPATPAVNCAKDNGANWNIARGTIETIVGQYCDKKIGQQQSPGHSGQTVGTNWPGRCSWSTDPSKKDPGVMAASFGVSSACPLPVPPLNKDDCTKAFGWIIDKCPTAANTPDGRYGGSVTYNCITYNWSGMTMGYTGLNINLNPGGNC